MAESAVFNLASGILSTIASPAFDKAYERGLSIWEARDELAKLRVTIETIQAVLLDAERKQESSPAVRNWIKRLKGVLYDADDLFDEVATDDLLKQQMMEGSNKLSLKNKVRVSCSKLNPIIARDSIAKKVKAIRKRLGEISTDMAKMGLVAYAREEEIPNVIRRGQDPGCFVDAKDVIGRDEDKKAILEMLFNKSNDAKLDLPMVIAIVGIGGMGKTTLAQLIYNDDEVKRNFEKRWFACISDISDEKEIMGKIFQSISDESYGDFTVGQLQNKIRELIEGKRFFLVLDDVWDENHDCWLKRMKLLNCGAKGSRIIVTTRSSSVPTATCALGTRILGGLSKDESWDLFKRLAFAPGTENDPRRIELGKGIVNKCANVPLAIRSIGRLLFEKNTIKEWELIRDEELPKLGQSHEDGIMPVLKLSYDHLPSNLKQCFAYCSLFPKDYKFEKQELIYLWIAQGYNKQNNEDAGHSDFMYLLRRGFFQEAKNDYYGEIKTCKMHDLIHDLAQHVASEESIMLTVSSNISNCVRHVSAGEIKIDELWAIPKSLHKVNRLRSFLFLNSGSIRNSALLDQLFANFQQLRALWLPRLGIEKVPDSIGELKHLRYLNLSGNKFEGLPDSVTNLLNLLTLDISWCSKLKALPGDLRKLINLRYLDIRGCGELKHMPAAIGELSCLQYLSHFKVGRRLIDEKEIKVSGLDQLVALDIHGCDKLKHMPARIGEMSCLQYLSCFKVGRRLIDEKEIKVSGLDQLSALEQLKGELSIEFEYGISDWDRDESWQLPQVQLQKLEIKNYPGKRIIPRCGFNGRGNNLAYVELRKCRNVKYLPSLRCLPNLKRLDLWGLEELEYVEDGDSCTTEVAGSSSFFPRLETLSLTGLLKLKGWWSEVATSSSSSSMFLSFPLLSHLHICNCPQLNSIPLCPLLENLYLLEMDGNMAIQQVLSNNSNSSPASPTTQSFQQILDSPLLQGIDIESCNTLEVIYLTTPKPEQIRIFSCQRLKKMHIAHPNFLEILSIMDCPELELKRGVDWGSLYNLRLLWLNPLPPPEKLPKFLRHRQSLGQLKITQF